MAYHREPFNYDHFNRLVEIYLDCTHEMILVNKRDSIGRPRLQHQCSKCGKPGRNYVSVSDADMAISEIPIFNDALYRSYFETWAAAKYKYDQYILTKRYTDYVAYIASDDWRVARLSVLKRSNGVCERCNAKKAKDVHHLTYDRLGHEVPTDLLAVCRECHDELHGHQLFGRKVHPK